MPRIPGISQHDAVRVYTKSMLRTVAASASDPTDHGSLALAATLTKPMRASRHLPPCE
ncbi:MAG: hypothetical protein R3F03_14250 [Opitutaceae bacterium]